MDSILDSVKSYCGILPEDTAFDSDIIMAINSVLVILNRDYGIGPEDGFSIKDDVPKWSDFLGDKPSGLIQEYVNMRARMLFDPPTGVYVKQALDEQIKEFEWRIGVDVDKTDYERRIEESE